jgi:hypothetical protein
LYKYGLDVIAALYSIVILPYKHKFSTFIIA